jgi:hypothetical protein
MHDPAPTFVVAVAVVPVVTYLRGYTGIVRFVGQPAEARVTRYEHDPRRSVAPAIGIWTTGLLQLRGKSFRLTARYE